MKWTVTLSTICAGLVLAGCEATGDVGGTRTAAHDELPFTFEVPSEFTEETIDEFDTRGTVIVGYGLTKVDLIAVRRLGSRRPPAGEVRHEVQGERVTSVLHPVADGYAIECQYGEDRAEKVRSACREAVESVEPRR